MTWIIVIILIFIAIQLIHSNKLKERKLEVNKEVKEEAEIDDLLKHKYPHIFYEMKDELRSYYHSRQEYSEIRNYPIVFKFQITKKIKKLVSESEHKKRIEDKLGEILKYSRSFFENLSRNKDITESEKDYISFLVWNRIDDSIYKPERILELDEDTIRFWHEEYEDFFPIKKV